MSSSEGENFDFDGISGSEFEEDYAPAKKVCALWMPLALLLRNLD